MNWWIGHVFVNRDLPVPTQRRTRKPSLVWKLAGYLGQVSYKLLIKLARKLQAYHELKKLQATHKDLSDHLLRDVGYTRSEWELLMRGKEVVRTAESIKPLPLPQKVERPNKAAEKPTRTNTIIHQKRSEDMNNCCLA